MTDSQNSSSNPPGSAQDSLPASDLWATQAAAAAPSSSPGGAPRATPPAEPGWERAVLEKLALAALTEQRAARRWKIFFRFAWLLLVLAIFGGAMMQLNFSKRRARITRQKSSAAFQPTKTSVCIVKVISSIYAAGRMCHQQASSKCLNL